MFPRSVTTPLSWSHTAELLFDIAAMVPWLVTVAAAPVANTP